MQEIERIRGAEDNLGFDIDLREYEKTLSDVIEIYFVVKVNKSDADDSLFLKKMTDGDIIASGTDELLIGVKWGANEYASFDIGIFYYAGLFIKFSDQTVADENVDQIFHLKIIEDMLNSN